MSDKIKTDAIIPTLLAGAAVYFGLSRNSGSIGDLAKEAVSRMINDQTNKQKEARVEKPVIVQVTPQQLPAPKKAKNRNRRRNKVRKLAITHNENKNNQV